MTAKLTPKQERFVAEYLVDLNATQAAIRAGYSEKVANTNGPRLLVNARVAAAIAERRGELQQATGVTQERVVAELAKIGFANLGDYFRLDGPEPVIDLANLTEDQKAAMSEITVDRTTVASGEDSETTTTRVRIKLHDKRAALVDLGKHLGLFSEKPTGPTINNNLTIVNGDQQVVNQVRNELVGIFEQSAAGAGEREVKQIDHGPEPASEQSPRSD